MLRQDTQTHHSNHTYSATRTSRQKHNIEHHRKSTYSYHIQQSDSDLETRGQEVISHLQAPEAQLQSGNKNGCPLMPLMPPTVDRVDFRKQVGICVLVNIDNWAMLQWSTNAARGKAELCTGATSKFCKGTFRYYCKILFVNSSNYCFVHNDNLALTEGLHV